MDARLNQLTIDFSAPMATPAFDGATYDALQDGPRLNTQLRQVRDYMADGQWRALHVIASATGYPEASISARLRDLRKPKFGFYTVQRRRVQECRGLFEYRVVV
jgi:hypothetical protein